MDKAWALELANKFETGEWGWTQGKLGEVVDGKMCYCTYGGLLAIHGVSLKRYSPNEFVVDWSADDTVDKYSMTLDASWDLETYLGDDDRDIVDYNDTDGRTMIEVIDMLRRYAAA